MNFAAKQLFIKHTTEK